MWRQVSRTHYALLRIVRIRHPCCLRRQCSRPPCRTVQGSTCSPSLRCRSKPSEPDAPVELEFSVLATAPASRPRRALKHGDTFIVIDNHGDIGATAGGTDGLFHADTRFLSHLELRLNGSQPLLLGSNVRDDNTLLAVDLTNPDSTYAGGADRAAEGHRARRAHDVPLARHAPISASRCAITATGRSSCSSSLHFDNDFADLFEVRGCSARAAARRLAQRHRGRTRCCCRYKGLDNVTAAHAAHLRSRAERDLRDHGVLSPRARAAANRSRSSCVISCTRAGRGSAGAVPARTAGGASRAARTIARRRHGRDLERAVQRGALPLGRRPRAC